MLDAYGVVTSPKLSVTLNHPIVAFITFTILTECTDFLVIRQWREEQVTVQASLRRHMKESDNFTAPNRLPRRFYF